MFHPTLWNQFRNTLNGEHRTNNICEGWNHAFNILVGERNPQFYKSLDAIQKDYAMAHRNLLASNWFRLKKLLRNILTYKSSKS